MKTITIDELIEEFCNDDTSEDVVAIFYDIFEHVMIKHPEWIKVVNPT